MKKKSTVKMNNEKMTSLQMLSQKVIVEGEMIAGKCEDSYLYLANEEMIVLGVFDGCGGSGARKYPVFGNHTGAYLGARIVCGVVHDWFDRYAAEIPEEKWLEYLKVEITRNLKRYAEKGGKSLIKGSMISSFPTTATFTVCRYIENKLCVEYIWAGDSRGYLLNKKGLFQITEDDVDGEDAMSNLTNDGVLTNMISASSNFVLHNRRLEPEMPCVVVNATDGCFNYLRSPMHFEYLLLDSLLSADNIAQWEKNLEQNMRAVSGDDHDLTMALFGYEEFGNIHEEYKSRLAYIEETYILPWDKAEPEEQQQLWLRYQREQVAL